MTLHEVIEKLLSQTGRTMTTVELANELNKNRWYVKKDGSSVQSSQIHSSIKKYSHIFNYNGSTVFLKKNTKDDIQIENELMNEKNFKSAATIDSIVPSISGLYCIRIKDIIALPTPFDKIIEERHHNIIYIGIATQSLNRRFLNQELRAKGHGTLFRSIGAILGYRPPQGLLREKVNKQNYKFSSIDEIKIIKWINSNLVVNWVEFNGNFEEIEKKLIEKYYPLLNIKKNPLALTELSDLRALCVKVANS